MFQNDFDKNLLSKSNFGKISLLKLTSAKFSVEVELRQNLLPKLDFGKKCNFGTTYTQDYKLKQIEQAIIRLISV